MSEHAHAIQQGHDAHGGGHAESGHLNARGYIKVALFLAIVTILEVAAFYLEAIRPILPWLLIAMSAVKFATVVGFFMHLKFDNRLFTLLFVGGLLIGGGMVLGLMTLFGSWTQVPLTHPGGH